VGPRAGLDAVVKTKIPSPCRESNPGSSSPWISAIPRQLSNSTGYKPHGRLSILGGKFWNISLKIRQHLIQLLQGTLQLVYLTHYCDYEITSKWEETKLAN
jgi:hypothetical protein